MKKKIPMMTHVYNILIGLLVAVVMGYFWNLRKGDIGGFVFGIIFTPTFVWGVNTILLRRKMRKQSHQRWEKNRQGGPS